MYNKSFCIESNKIMSEKKQTKFYVNKSKEVGNCGRWMDLDMGSYFNILKIAEIVGKYVLLCYLCCL